MLVKIDEYVNQHISLKAELIPESSEFCEQFMYNKNRFYTDKSLDSV